MLGNLGLLIPGLKESFDNFVNHKFLLRLRLSRVIAKEIGDASVSHLVGYRISMYVNLVKRRDGVLPSAVSLNLGEPNLVRVSVTNTILD